MGTASGKTALDLMHDYLDLGKEIPIRRGMAADPKLQNADACDLIRKEGDADAAGNGLIASDFWFPDPSHLVKSIIYFLRLYSSQLGTPQVAGARQASAAQTEF